MKTLTPEFERYLEWKFLGWKFKALEFEEQAEVRGYMREGLVRLLDGVVTRREVLAELAERMGEHRAPR